jgi:hypothetical protein
MSGTSAVFYNRIAPFLIFARGRVPERGDGGCTACPVSTKLTFGLSRFGAIRPVGGNLYGCSYKRPQDILKFDVLAIDRSGIRHLLASS